MLRNLVLKYKDVFIERKLCIWYGMIFFCVFVLVFVEVVNFCLLLMFEFLRIINLLEDLLRWCEVIVCGVYFYVGIEVGYGNFVVFEFDLFLNDLIGIVFVGDF